MSAFSAREGIAISTVTYNDNGTVRPLFYRLSLAEMVVPYAEASGFASRYKALNFFYRWQHLMPAR